MARGNVRVNWKGVEEKATSPEMHAALEEVGKVIASNAESQHVKVGAIKGNGQIDLPVEVSEVENTTDMRIFNRGKVWVTLAHPAGRAAQAKYGVLTKAAAEAGIKVKERPAR